MNETQTPFFADTQSAAERNEQPKTLVQYKKKIHGIVFLLIPFFLSMFFAWKNVGDMIVGEGGGLGWSFPVMLFSLGISILLLIALIDSNRAVLFLLSLSSALLSLLVFYGFSSVMYIVLGTLLIWYGMLSIRRDLPKNIHISILKSIRQGSSYIILGFSIVISCAYYFTIVHMNFTDLMKQFEIRKSSERIVNQVMATLNPEFKQIHENRVTVDEFLDAVQKSQVVEQTPETTVESLSDEELLKIAGIDPASPKAPAALAEIKKQIGKSVSQDSAEIRHKIVIAQYREQFSNLIGRDLTGQEYIADVFSDMIEKEALSYTQPRNGKDSSLSTIAFVLAVILFLTLVSLGSVLKYLWILAVKLIFSAFVKLGIVRIKKVSVEQEVIE